MAGKDPGTALRNKEKLQLRPQGLETGTGCLFPLCFCLLASLFCIADTPSLSPWKHSYWQSQLSRWERTVFFRFSTSSPGNTLALSWSPVLNILSINVNLVLTTIWLTIIFLFYLFVYWLFPSPLEYELHERRHFACLFIVPLCNMCLNKHLLNECQVPHMNLI